MHIESFHNHCISKKGAVESTPFPKLPNILVYKVCGKMFAVGDLDNFDSFTVKADTDKIDDLKASYPGISSPPYFSPKYWISVPVNQGLNHSFLVSLIDRSYDLIVEKLTRKQKEELQGL